MSFDPAFSIANAAPGSGGIGGATSAASASAGGGMSGLGVAGAALMSPLLLGLDYGLNAASTSRAQDRQKNWATRKYQYELIALKEAGINPAYLFNNLGKNAGMGTRAPQQGSVSAQMPQAALATAAAQIANIKAETDLKEATAAKTRAEIPRIDAEIGRTNAQRDLTTAELRYAERRLEAITPKMIADAMRREGQAATWPQAIVDFLNKVGSGDTTDMENAGAAAFIGYIMKGDIKQALIAGKGLVSKVPARFQIPALLMLAVTAGLFASYGDALDEAQEAGASPDPRSDQGRRVTRDRRGPMQ